MKRIWRTKFILSKIKGKNILDIGSCNEQQTKRLFSEYKQKAKSVQGMDLKSCGKDIIVADAQNFNLGKKFDIIIVGEVVEHLSNYKGFFESCSKHMNKDSELLITTPNAYSALRMAAKVIKREVPNFVHHTVLFDEITFQNMVRKNNFKITEKYYYEDEKPKSSLYKLNVLISSIIPKFSSGYAFILKKNKNEKD